MDESTVQILKVLFAAASSGLSFWSLLCHWCSRWILAILTKFHWWADNKCYPAAQTPEACDTCLEYFTGCALCTWCEAHVRHCSGISSPFLFCTQGELLCSTINLQTDATALLVPVFQYPETLEDRAEEPWVSRGAGVPLNPYMRA